MDFLKPKNEDEIKAGILKLAETDIKSAFDIVYKNYLDKGQNVFEAVGNTVKYLNVTYTVEGVSRRLKGKMNEDLLTFNPDPDYIEDAVMIAIKKGDKYYHHAIEL